jgi:hypothetical protein
MVLLELSSPVEEVILPFTEEELVSGDIVEANAFIFSDP